MKKVIYIMLWYLIAVICTPIIAIKTHNLVFTLTAMSSYVVIFGFIGCMLDLKGKFN